MQNNESQLTIQLAELTSKIETVLEKQDELAEAIDKIKEAVYNPDQGLYARLRELEQKTQLRISNLEDWKNVSTRITWIIVTGVLGLFITTIWKLITP